MPKGRISIQKDHRKIQKMDQLQPHGALYEKYKYLSPKKNNYVNLHRLGTD